MREVARGAEDHERARARARRSAAGRRAAGSRRRAQPSADAPAVASAALFWPIVSIRSSNDFANDATPSSTSSTRADPVDVDAGGAHLVEQPVGAGDVAVDRARGRAVVARGVDRRVGHRVDRVRPDQLVDVERVGVGRVLGRRRRPERPLHVRALGGERLPARAREDPLERLVGDAARSRSRPCPAGRCARPSRARASTLPSTRETKKLATDARPSIGLPAATRRSRPAM